MSFLTGTFTFLSPGSNGQVVGRSTQILLRPGPAWPLSGVGTSVTVSFSVNGVVVGTSIMAISAAIWSWQGILPSGIPAGTAFRISVHAHNAAVFFSIDGDGAIDAFLENVVPSISIDPIQTPKAVTQLPYMCTITGSASEGNGAPYGVARVDCQVNGGPFSPATPITPGNWSRWSIQVPLSSVGTSVITARAMDDYNAARFASVFPTVALYQVPATTDPNAKKTKNLQIPTSSSVTSWTRLEPQVTNADIAITSNARVFDPLWLMTRQWQVGEFQGEDAGSPVQARVRATAAPLTRAVFGELPAPGSGVTPTVQPYDPMRAPLETLVERRRMRAADATDSRMLKLAVEAGLHFLRMIELDTKAKKYRPAFLANYLLQQLPTQPPPITDDATTRYVQRMVGRAPDARRLATAFRPSAPKIAFDAVLKITATDLTAVQAVATAWLAWYDALFAEPGSAADDAWVPPRLEYAVSVATRLSAAPQDGVTLSASEFDGGRLDWSSFDINTTRAIDTTADHSFVPVNETTVPAPVTFRGAPAPRFWEMEDAKVAYGLVPVGPTDLAHLMMIEYAGSYGNDWYVIPLTTQVGTVTRVDSLVVTDTFGVRSLVRPIGDPALPTPYFSLWQQSSRRYAGDALGGPIPNRFFLPPTIARSTDGAVLEEVLLLRDEMANLAWGIERNVEGAAEAPVSLVTAAPSNAVISPPAVPGASGLPRYLLSSAVAENWIPLLPVQVRLQANGPLLSRLKRGAVLQPDGSNRVHHSQTETLASLGSGFLYDEEVPREGARITRRRRMARWIDGSTWVWTGYRNEVGSGEGSAGLEFDQLLSPDGNGALLPTAPPVINPPTLSPTTLVIDGPSVTHTTQIVNSSTGLLNVVLQGWINQGTVRRAATDGFIDCGSGVGVVPSGTSTVSGSIVASNTGNGTGTLVPGAATLELQLRQGSDVIATTSAPVPVTLMSNAPPSITVLTPSVSSAFIGGPVTPYAATLVNTGITHNNVVLQGWVNQGAARRAAGGAMVTCAGSPIGVLPNGTFNVSGSISVANTSGGTGTLVPGAATFELQLIENGTVLFTKIVPITLQPPTAGIATLGSSFPSVLIGGASPYAATLRNPGATLSNVVLQGWLNQGAVRRAAGGTMVMCGAGVGILPTGMVNVTGTISASNTTGGPGVLVDGPATFELQMTMNGTLLETKTIPVFLTTAG
jgi:hypothetical protein